MEKEIKDFKEWLGMVEPNVEEIYHIYNAVEGLTEVGAVNVTQNPNGTWFVRYYGHTPLLLTEASRNAMLCHIRHAYCDGLDMETWHGVEYNMAKND